MRHLTRFWWRNQDPNPVEDVTMIDVFGWLRKKARDAVLGGIADAVQEVAPGDAPADLDGLRVLLARADVKALAATGDPAPEPEPVKRKAK